MSERNADQRENVCVKKGRVTKNVMQYGKHINNFVEQGEMEKAMSAARDMMNRGIEPNVMTFTTLI